MLRCALETKFESSSIKTMPSACSIKAADNRKEEERSTHVGVYIFNTTYKEKGIAIYMTTST
jgi:hypothetical protein